MFLDHAVDGAQAKARALADGLGRIERIEDAVRLFDTGARIGELNHSLVALPAGGYFDKATAGSFQRVLRVFQDLRESLEQLVTVAPHAGQVGSDNSFDAKFQLSALQLPHLHAALDQRAQINQRLFARTLLRKIEQVQDEVAGALRLADNLAHKLVLFGGETLARPELLGIIHHRGEGMLDLAGCAGNQLAERSKFLPLHQMALQALLVLVALARSFQQVDQCLILQILPDEKKCAQHQHRDQRGEKPEGARGRRRMIPAVGPQTEYW